MVELGIIGCFFVENFWCVFVVGFVVLSWCDSLILVFFLLKYLYEKKENDFVR